MTEEFKLIEKVIHDEDSDIILRDDVKEFIRLLKEELTTGNQYMDEVLRIRLGKLTGDL